MKKAILAGPCLGEMYWEIGRFATHAIWKKKQNPDRKLIVLTRPDRFDMYGEHADILVPLRIEGDGVKYKGDCYRLQKFPPENYTALVNAFNKQFENRYKIKDHLYPNLKGKNFANKYQFSTDQMVFDDFRPRVDNGLIVSEIIPNDRPLVVIAPRFRPGLRRNWPHWQELYDMIADSDLMEKFYFVLCGKLPDHIPDKKGRFFDINNFRQTKNTSLIGFTLECLNRAVFTVGSQSGIPNISLLFKVEVLEWGHQRTLHTNTYNIFNSKITFIDDSKYKTEAKTIFKNMNKRLSKRGKKQ